VDPVRADELVGLCQDSGAGHAAVIGSVADKSDNFLVFTG
jgi:hypothetical protein